MKKRDAVRYAASACGGGGWGGGVKGTAAQVPAIASLHHCGIAALRHCGIAPLRKYPPSR